MQLGRIAPNGSFTPMRPHPDSLPILETPAQTSSGAKTRPTPPNAANPRTSNVAGPMMNLGRSAPRLLGNSVAIRSTFSICNALCKEVF